MSTLVRCGCGKTLQVPDSAAGSKIRCGSCKAVLTVPAADVPVVPAAETRLTSARSQPAAEPRQQPIGDDVRERPRPMRKPSGGSKVWIFVLLGVGAVLLLGCVTIGGVVAYFAFSGRSAESQLIGDWEMDPEPWQKVADKGPLGGMFMPDVKLTFNKDHTFKLVMMVEMTGRWQVVSHSGNQWQVKLTMQTFGMDQSYPPTVSITVVDKDHFEFTSNQPSMVMAGRFRRVGTGPPVKSIRVGVPGAVGLPGGKGPPQGNGMPGLDVGMKPDCEVEWNGVWYPAKILKTEKDRWFIHYVGWQSHWDEWVDKKRIRFKK